MGGWLLQLNLISDIYLDVHVHDAATVQERESLQSLSHQMLDFRFGETRLSILDMSVELAALSARNEEK